MEAICALGVDLYAALHLVRARGYVAGGSASYPFPASACSAVQSTGTIASFMPIVDQETAKALLVNSGPLVADMYIWEDFFDFTTSRASSYVADLSREGPYLHSVCVVGFNSEGWIIKNSFGRSWGDGQGFGTIAHGQCALLGSAPPSNRVQRQAFALRL